MNDSEMIDELTRLHDDGLPSHRYYELIGLHLPCILALARRAVELEAENARLRAENAKAEQLVCDFQAASMLEVGNQGGPCCVQPIHVENHVNELRAENTRLREALDLVITKDTTLVGYARQPYVGPCGQIARAALAPQDGGQS